MHLQGVLELAQERQQVPLFGVGNELWGWVAEVLPLTRWSGAQNIRIGLRFYHNTPNFQSISAHTVVWRLFKVS